MLHLLPFPLLASPNQFLMHTFQLHAVFSIYWIHFSLQHFSTWAGSCAFYGCTHAGLLRLWSSYFFICLMLQFSSLVGPKMCKLRSVLQQPLLFKAIDLSSIRLKHWFTKIMFSLYFIKNKTLAKGNPAVLRSKLLYVGKQTSSGQDGNVLFKCTLLHQFWSNVNVLCCF